MTVRSKSLFAIFRGRHQFTRRRITSSYVWRNEEVFKTFCELFDSLALLLQVCSNIFAKFKF